MDSSSSQSSSQSSSSSSEDSDDSSSLSSSNPSNSSALQIPTASSTANENLNKSSSSGSFVSVSSAPLPSSSPTKQFDVIEVIVRKPCSTGLDGSNGEEDDDAASSDAGSALNEGGETEISTLLLSARVSGENVLDPSSSPIKGEKGKGSAPPAAEVSSPTGSQSSASSVSTTEELDVCSSKFDPLKALYSPFFPLDPEAPVFDNVEKFVSVYEERGRERCAKAKARTEAETRAATGSSAPRTRQFLPEQMPIAGTRKEFPNVMKYMSRQEDGGGPMSLLSRCVKDNTRVKVYVRGIDRLRGHCTGFIVAFDKHWNLAMVDVDEVYTRRRFLKTPPAMDTWKDKRKAGDEKTEQVGASLVRVVKSRRKNQLCERHAPQLVIRGEHVALVSIS